MVSHSLAEPPTSCRKIFFQLFSEIYDFNFSYLEILLRNLEMFPRSVVLADRRVDDPLEDVLLRHGGLQVLDEGIRLAHVVLPEEVDHQVEAGLGDDVYQGGEDLDREY